MSLPNVSDVRSRIEAIEAKDIKRLFQTVYLFGLRIGEACGYRYPSETKSQNTGMLLWATQETWQPRIEDDEEMILLKRLMIRNYGKELTDMEVLQLNEQAFVLSIITEKREGFNRKAAIPLSPEYEPWAKEVTEYIQERQTKGPLPYLQRLTQAGGLNGKPISIIEVLKTEEADRIIETYEPVFPFRRQEVLPMAIRLFQGFTYPITQYKKRVGHNEEGKGVYETVPEHQKQFGDHALRHLRSTELKSFYRVHGEALDKFMGWSKPRGGESSAMQDRYVLEPWREAGYFPRLLRRRA
jgi:hypothetical protein